MKESQSDFSEPVEQAYRFTRKKIVEEKVQFQVGTRTPSPFKNGHKGGDIFWAKTLFALPPASLQPPSRPPFHRNEICPAFEIIVSQAKESLLS